MQAQVTLVLRPALSPVLSCTPEPFQVQQNPAMTRNQPQRKQEAHPSMEHCAFAAFCRQDLGFLLSGLVFCVFGMCLLPFALTDGQK